MQNSSLSLDHDDDDEKKSTNIDYFSDDLKSYFETLTLEANMKRTEIQKAVQAIRHCCHQMLGEPFWRERDTYSSRDDIRIDHSGRHPSEHAFYQFQQLIIRKMNKKLQGTQTTWLANGHKRPLDNDYHLEVLTNEFFLTFMLSHGHISLPMMVNIGKENLLLYISAQMMLFTSKQQINN